MRWALVLLGCMAALLGCSSGNPPAPAVDASGLPREGEGGQPRFGYTGDPLNIGAGLGRVAGSGADTMRRLLSWHGIERAPGQLDWSRTDGIYRQLIRQGTRPLWVLAGAPCWASALGSACDPTRPGNAVGVDHADDLARFLAAATRRYPESLGFEVANEQNLAVYWRGGLHPGDYATLLGAAADAVHAADPEMAVISGGLAPTESRSVGKLPWRGYVRAIYAAGVDERIDAIGFHPYAAREPGQELAPATARLIREVRRLLRSLGDREMPIWVTEVGLSTAGPYAVSAAEQARGLVRIYRHLRRLDVAVIIIHRLVDRIFPAYPGDAGFGVIGPDAVTPKPAYCALARVRGKPCS